MTYLFEKVFVGGPLCGTDLEMNSNEVPSTIDVQKGGSVHRYRFRQVDTEPGFQFLHLGKKEVGESEDQDYTDEATLRDVDENGTATFFIKPFTGQGKGEAQDPDEAG